MSEHAFRRNALIGLFVIFACVASAQPVIATGGVLNAGSFQKDAAGHGTPVAPGSLVSIFGTGLGTSQADADSVPFSTSLGGVGVTFNNIKAPLRDVIPAAQLVNAQIPFNVLPAGQTTGSVSVVVTVNGVATAPQLVNIVPQAPGIFTIPPGVGNVVLVNLTDGTIAGPAGKVGGLASNPIPRGTFAYFYATGLGIMTPAVANGDGPSGRFDANLFPQVTIGGMPTQVLFAGQAPGFPGVYQVNVQIPQSAPTGDGISVRMISNDGTQQSPDNVATISVR